MNIAFCIAAYIAVSAIACLFAGRLINNAKRRPDTAMTAGELRSRAEEINRSGVSPHA